MLMLMIAPNETGLLSVMYTRIGWQVPLTLTSSMVPILSISKETYKQCNPQVKFNNERLSTS